MIKVIIFDMNGIIIDDEYIHKLAFKKIVEKYGIMLGHKDYLNLCAGKTDNDGFRNIAKKYKKSINLKNSLLEKSSLYLHLFPKYKKVYLGVIKLICDLGRKYRLALTSSSSYKEVDLVIKVFGLGGYFDVIVTADDVTKGKPDPQPYLLTAKKLNVLPEECIVIEDSPSGVLSAKSAGMKCVGITTTHSKDNLKDADKVVNTFKEVEDVLWGWMAKDKITKND